jgi:signal transduction histidine kinase
MKETLEELIQTIHITRGAFVILRDKDGLYPVVSEGFEKEPVYGLDFIQDFSSRKRIFVLEEEDDEKLKQTMRDANLTVILPLFEDDHIQGVLLLGEKKSGEIYSQQDIQVLEIFGPEVSVAIQNAKAYEEISRFNVTLKEEVDKATKDLQNANERLKDLDKLKDEFVSIASHELRTPMTAIRSYLWMALAGQGGELTDKQRFYVQRGYNSVERLIKLVNDMLNVSRIESGRISLEMQKTDMTTLIQEVIDEVTPRADELGLHIRLDGSTVPSSVLADPDKIKEVLFNLIGNSLKFTPKDGTVTVGFSQQDGMVVTTVSDTGAGIEQANIPNLFQKFGILPGSYAANQSAMGTGLGLYICKSIIELHDGKIWAESDGKGKGTRFLFSLPVFSEERLAQFHEKHKSDHQEHVGLEHTEL